MYVIIPTINTCLLLSVNPMKVGKELFIKSLKTDYCGVSTLQKDGVHY